MLEKIWYRDDGEENLAAPHHTNPPQYLSPDELYKKTGVKYEAYPLSVCDDKEALERIPKERDFATHDYVSLDPVSNKSYYGEHLHDDPEIRLIIAGGGYFEVRSLDDRWVRIHVEKGDMLNLPPGIWHRLALDEKDNVSMLRLFKETPGWRAEWRSKGENPPARQRYLNTMAALA